MNQKLESELNEMESVRQSNFNILNRQRIDALSRGDAGNYFLLCNELGLEPEDLALYERGNLDADREEFFESKRSFKSQGRVSRREYQKFISSVDKSKINFMNVWADTLEKMKILERFGYAELKVGGKGYLPLKDCSPSRVGNAIIKIYKTAQRSVGLRH